MDTDLLMMLIGSTVLLLDILIIMLILQNIRFPEIKISVNGKKEKKANGKSNIKKDEKKKVDNDGRITQ